MAHGPAEQARIDRVHAGSQHAEALLLKAGTRVTSHNTPQDSPRWYQDTLAALQQAGRDGTASKCPHLAHPQPTALLAEQPDKLLCWNCYEQSRPVRRCHLCKAPAGTQSLHGGIESVVRGPAVVYSRILCPSCANPGPTEPAGTFGNGR
ncbi:hypothetical protein ABTX81_30690 [Kitasatospora sp. NPDC097605]|uniref:hypothetical protein n=1 Tax=Kitasatospora sp. NPDC097605 TaxID=3157226 RepID=UPI00333394F8